MKQDRFVLQPKERREASVSRLLEAVMALPLGKTWRIIVEEAKPTRSLAQNAYLWGCVYPTILREGGEQLRGWTADDLHEYFLGEWSGWEVIKGFGRKRMRPRHRSSRLSTLQFMDYVDTVQRKAAELGIVIPDPDPHWREHAKERAA